MSWWFCTADWQVHSLSWLRFKVSACKNQGGAQKKWLNVKRWRLNKEELVMLRAGSPENRVNQRKNNKYKCALKVYIWLDMAKLHSVVVYRLDKQPIQMVKKEVKYMPKGKRRKICKETGKKPAHPRKYKNWKWYGWVKCLNKIKWRFPKKWKNIAWLSYFASYRLYVMCMPIEGGFMFEFTAL